MKISDAASLGLHAMVYLAANPDRLVSNAEIAGGLNISEAHLSKVLQSLVKAGLANSTRGPTGGFSLERAGDEITLLEVYETIEGPLVQTDCLLGKPACDGKHCIMGGLLKSVDLQVKEYLAGKTLNELIEVFN